MKILVAAPTIRQAENAVRMLRPGVVAQDGFGRVWKAVDDWYMLAVPGEKLARGNGFDRALVIGLDARGKAWVEREVVPAMGGVGTEMVVM